MQLPKFEYLHELIKLAIDDMKIIKKDDRYEFDVKVYHSHLLEKPECAVCVAGCIIANTLKADYRNDVKPVEFEKYTAECLYILDEIRTGAIEESLIDYHFCVSNEEKEIIFDGFDLHDGETEEWEKLHEYLVDHII